jgi:hypothetical protein
LQKIVDYAMAGGLSGGGFVGGGTGGVGVGSPPPPPDSESERSISFEKASVTNRKLDAMMTMKSKISDATATFILSSSDFHNSFSIGLFDGLSLQFLFHFCNPLFSVKNSLTATPSRRKVLTTKE